ncbi:MAG: hypothetical protein UV58_C0010G0012 [Candidatus Wolfebacteria bacterium GW2011_GWC1_43_10]|uniref:Uncharacterized protein n=1 Tax=Candidatus Wolfebacteria bacterium GW2011_GWC1_43_10 TaxID=1619011 RepID=A0A0G1CA15_9BACT|nr:MAG: hypothetical protein UV58_C0010G0012 [Candidatus Wolfebacteria bacterium GW2011_GWC1_43_10]
MGKVRPMDFPPNFVSFLMFLLTILVYVISYVIGYVYRIIPPEGGFVKRAEGTISMLIHQSTNDTNIYVYLPIKFWEGQVNLQPR